MTPDTTTRSIRRGLPRVRGGEPWPPAASVEVAPRTATTDAPAAAPARIRRGLPRVAGGPAWPDVDVTAVRAAPVAEAPATSVPEQAKAPEIPPVRQEPVVAATPAPAPAPAAAPASAPAPGPAAAVAPPAAQVRPAPASVAASPAAAAEPRTYRGLTVAQWVWRSIGGAAAIVAFAGLVMLAARGLLTFAWAQDFVKRFPGAYALPESAPTGFPLWLEWQHFLNAFFILLVIRTGIQIRGERKPRASWSPRWNNKRRISLTVWLHQSLDLLWVANGAVFIVLLFTTGQWMRIVPTSWSVFPNAFTAGLKYASMNWPTEDGWANYNSLQQLSYFAVVFLLTPLALVTGFRMSGLWKREWTRLSRLYRAPLARAVHFPTMIVFCAFIVVHVVLVLATGALRNLNHMYGHSDVVSWTGFWLFVAALAVMAAGWVAARPLVTAPIASLFGKVGR